jgi:hypothetical protein
MNTMIALVAFLSAVQAAPSMSTAFSSFYGQPDCPDTAGPFGSASYNNLQSNLANCLSSDAVLGCLADKYNYYDPANDAVILQFAFGDTSRINDQMTCEYYAIMMDCIANSASAPCDGAVKACFAEDCSDSTRQCYDNSLDSTDPEQNLGCAVPTSGAYVDSVPAYTWRTLRDSLDAQTCVCDGGRGYLDELSYYAWRSNTAASGPHTVLQSATFCKLNSISLGGFGDTVTADVADQHAQLVCDLSHALVSCAKDEYDMDADIDEDIQDTCYDGRDYSNSIGVATGTSCYAACDPVNSATLLASVLLVLL